MKFYPTLPNRQFLYFIILSILLILSCSKDSDLLNDAIFNGAEQSIEDRESQKEDETEEEVEAEVIEIKEVADTEEEALQEEEPLASRTTAFLPIQDAYLQNGDGVNDPIIKLQENNRVSYLLFDLSAIDSIGGKITDTHFEFTINQDPGHGEIKIHKGGVTKWTEQDIDIETAPKQGIELGTIDKVYAIGKTEIVQLKATEIVPEITTLILTQLTGNGITIASKEHPTEEAPKLVVTYNTALDAQAIEDYFPAVEDSTEEEEEEVQAEQEEEVSDTDELNDEVVNESPTAKIEAKPTKGEAPLVVDFRASGSTDDLAIKAYGWDFMDGTTSRTKNPTHVFEKAGTYEVELTVADEEGLTDVKTITITVKEPENAAPVAKAAADKTKGEVPLKVVFDGGKSTDDSAIKSHQWDFKDGTTSSAKRPSHTFKKEGTYEVELTVTDEKGLTGTTTITIVVEKASNQAPVAVANANVKSGDAPLEVTFSGNNSSDDNEVVSYSWDFGSYGVVSQKNPKQIFEDPGTYEVVLTVQDSEGLSHSNSITIRVNEPPIPETTSTSADVRHWQNLFDSKWSQERSHAYSLSNSSNRDQEYYYLAYYIDGLSSIWQATGNNSYLDTALELINNTVNDAQSVGRGYEGWRASDGNQYDLWDTFYWRHVATILRIINQSPQLRSSSKYRNQYEKLLAFSEKNIWDRYESQDITKIYRSKTHMASHWARIGMELYLITKKSKYKKVFDNISFGTMASLPSNLRNQLFPNPKDKSAYAWDHDWGVSYGSVIQDTAHGGPVVSFITLAYSNGMYWSKSDINALLRTVDVIWPSAYRTLYNVDGSGGAAAKGRLHEWFYLARYSQELQNRIRKEYDQGHLNYYGSQVLGIAALNAKILADGSAVYP